LNETILAGEGNNNITGSAFNDHIVGGLGGSTFSTNVFDGGAGNDTLESGAASDRLVGGDGNDVIHSGAGSDNIWGDAGDDIIDVGLGTDGVYGGAGRDTFLFTTAEVGADVIVDYKPGEDHISFAGLGLAYADLHISTTQYGDILVEAGTHQIYLAGFDAALLTPDNFSF
jgi:Ca2+-binding RTX toxin-like protein